MSIAAEPEPVAPEHKPRWYRLTLCRLLVALLAVECLLWLSNRIDWPTWRMGYAVLTAVGVVSVVLTLMLLWYLAALVFRVRFQFSLRSLLAMVVVVAIPCSWLATEMRRARAQRELIAWATDRGFNLYYDWEVDAAGDPLKAPQPPQATVLREWLGADFVDEVADAGTLSNVVDEGREEISDVDIKRLQPFARLQRLAIGSKRLTNAGMEHLVGLPRLHVLGVVSEAVTNDGLKPVGRLKNLDVLLLYCTNITDAGLTHLRDLKLLRQLTLVETKVTPAGVKQLQGALPDCRIVSLELGAALSDRQTLAPWEFMMNASRSSLPRMLTSNNSEARRLAAKELKSQTAIDVLIAALGTDSGEDLEADIYVLAEIGADAAPSLAAALRSGDKRTRLAATTALRDMAFRAKAVLPDIISALADSDPQVRAMAAEALGMACRENEDDEAAIPGLCRALHDPDKEVRWKAVGALQWMTVWGNGQNDLQPAAALLKAVPELADVVEHDADDWVRGDAAVVLGRIGPASSAALPALRRAPAGAYGGVRSSADEAVTRILPHIFDAAVTAIQRAGGRVEISYRTPGGEVEAIRPNRKIERGFTDAEMKYVAEFAQLKKLCVSNTSVTDAGLGQLRGLKQLEELDLESTTVSDAGLETLWELAQLKKLRLKDTHVTAAGVEKLRKRLPKCEINWEPPVKGER